MEKVKTVVITGSSRGLGLEMAKCFRRQGSTSCLTDVVARFLVSPILKNKKNDAHILWLTGAKVIRKLITAGLISAISFLE